jgi:predicted ATPase/class 3 adenylate cyclase
MATLPTGTVTYLMTDIVGSARLWEADPEGMAASLRVHDHLAKEAAKQHDGKLVKSRGEGDSLFMVFAHPNDAVLAAVQFIGELSRQHWPSGIELKVRAAIHTGTSEVRDSDYYGPAVNRCARLRSIANAGQILVSRAALVEIGDSKPAGVVFNDLGTHRLKDLLRPESVCEIVHPDLPKSTGSLESLNRIQHNLPVQLTSFIGRQGEVLRIRSMLQAARLVTLTGSGGCGKTRLALQIGAESGEDFRDGVWFVDLTRIPPDEDCASLVAKTLHLQDRPDLTALEEITETFSQRRALIIFDNCEHVVDQAAEVVSAILEHCPEMVVLATSREVLRIQGEVRCRVPSLSVPAKGADFKTMESSESVRLFCERASLREPDFDITEKNAEAIADLCRLLDGIPLAIEQAASHASLLTAQQMFSRFKKHLSGLQTSDRGVVPRHRTIRATIEWSYETLSDEEKVVLQRCSVFVGGWTVEAAEKVCAGDGIEEGDVPFLLNSLLSKSLVIQVESASDRARYRLLETVREFASERLGAAVEEVSARHAGYFKTLAGELEATADWVSAQEDHENLWMAMEWYVRHEPEAALNFALRLRSYIIRTGHLREGRTLFINALDAATQDRERAAGYNVLGSILISLGDDAGAKVAYDQSLTMWRQLDVKPMIAVLLHNLGLVSASTKDYARAKELLQESSELYKALGDSRGIGIAMTNLARAQLELSEYKSAVTSSCEARDLLMQAGDTAMAAVATGNLATAYFLLGKDKEAVAALGACFQIWRSTVDRGPALSALAVLAGIAARQGCTRDAHRLALQSQVMGEEIDYKLGDVERMILDKVLDTMSSRGEIVASVDYTEAVERAAQTCEQLTLMPE